MVFGGRHLGGVLNLLQLREATDLPAEPHEPNVWQHVVVRRIGGEQPQLELTITPLGGKPGVRPHRFAVRPVGCRAYNMETVGRIPDPARVRTVPCLFRETKVKLNFDSQGQLLERQGLSKNQGCGSLMVDNFERIKLKVK